ncbi:hypothetical protein [Rosenbergiella nectarea]|uniref:hypothetical protein n=1 Tax=Rosenbergiella nectarea TaxID=988801 RepID=UPI001BDA845C|nr:hypothetical protein [Rosenbergiella nectarea]MBT0731284.1 hypothetical protein [Rosenbergiella nectarea subsp. apis]
MRNYFKVTGHATNKLGSTVAINYQIFSSDIRYATAHAMKQAQQEGFTQVRITKTKEVRA